MGSANCPGSFHGTSAGASVRLNRSKESIIVLMSERRVSVPGYRLGVMALASTAIVSLVLLGVEPLQASAIVMVAVAGGVETARRVTAPHPAFGIRIWVLVLILVLIVELVATGHPPLVVVPGVLVTAWFMAESARRLTGSTSKWLPKVSIAF